MTKSTEKSEEVFKNTYFENETPTLPSEQNTQIQTPEVVIPTLPPIGNQQHEGLIYDTSMEKTLDDTFGYLIFFRSKYLKILVWIDHGIEHLLTY